MPVSFYDLTVGSYTQIVEAAAGVLQKGADHCQEKGIGLDDVVATCLIDGMANFHFQVVCITHLPQIAGMAETHFAVSKASRKGRTSARVRRLDRSERVDELARMLGGEKITGKTREAAEEMLIPASREPGR